jgi:L,D-peptidoglycan transpeptidase YkuD (ErfK/YbiS/YcfS/YnhG family)
MRSIAFSLLTNDVQRDTAFRGFGIWRIPSVAVLALAAAVALACPPGPAVQATGTQLVTVEARSLRTTHAALRTWERRNGCWRGVAGPYPARVGWSGLSRDRREGDGTTPAGIFGFLPTMYGLSPSPGLRYRYHRIVCGDWWVEDPAYPAYNTFVHTACNRRPPFRTTTPDMSKSPTAYAFLAVIEFNMHPVVPGRGSGIFLHVQTGRPTNGCVSLPRAELASVLRWLRPGARPQIAIGTRADLR